MNVFKRSPKTSYIFGTGYLPKDAFFNIFKETLHYNELAIYQNSDLDERNIIDSVIDLKLKFKKNWTVSENFVIFSEKSDLLILRQEIARIQLEGDYKLDKNH